MLIAWQRYLLPHSTELSDFRMHRSVRTRGHCNPWRYSVAITCGLGRHNKRATIGTLASAHAFPSDYRKDQVGGAPQTCGRKIRMVAPEESLSQVLPIDVAVVSLAHGVGI